MRGVGRHSDAGPAGGRMRRPIEPVYSTAIAAGLALFRFWRLKPHARGVEQVPTSGGAVLAITHFGYLDFALVE